MPHIRDNVHFLSLSSGEPPTESEEIWKARVGIEGVRLKNHHKHHKNPSMKQEKQVEGIGFVNQYREWHTMRPNEVDAVRRRSHELDWLPRLPVRVDRRTYVGTGTKPHVSRRNVQSDIESRHDKEAAAGRR